MQKDPLDSMIYRQAKNKLMQKPSIKQLPDPIKRYKTIAPELKSLPDFMAD